MASSPVSSGNKTMRTFGRHLRRRGRAFDNLPVASFEQRLYADGWLRECVVDLHAVLQDAACGAGPGIPEPAD